VSSSMLAVVVAIARLLLAWILGRAALHKVRGWSQFVAQLRAYRLLPEILIAPIAVTLTIVEAATAIALLQWNLAALIAAALFALYGGAMAINLARGRTDLGCGCGGPLAARTTIDWLLVARNAALTSIALLVCLTATAPPAGIEYLIILGGGLGALLAYEAAEQAIANRQQVVAWKRRAALTEA
jgi:hypothetical protein